MLITKNRLQFISKQRRPANSPASFLMGIVRTLSADQGLIIAYKW